MTIRYKTGFEKKTRRLSPKIAAALAERIRLFMSSPHDPLLHNHALKGRLRGYRSINVTGDWRLIYEPLGETGALLVDVDTHHNLYGT